MFKTPINISSNLNILIPRQVGIRRSANDFEDRLKDKYLQPQIIGVPDELDPEIPRMVFGSKNGFSQITVSQVNISLVVKYSPDWGANVQQCRDYLLERVPLLASLLKTLSVEPLYLGLLSHVNLPSDQNDANILKKLSDVFIKEQSESYQDIQIKLTKVIEDKFFSNVTVQNYRTWKLTPGEQRPKLANQEAIEKGVSIVGDFNDRYAFNEKKDYKSNLDQVSQIIDLGIKETQGVIKRITA